MNPRNSYHRNRPIKKRKQQIEVQPPTLTALSQAVFIINRHAKTAPNPKFLYSLKKKALQKLLQEGKAKKVGLHYSRNPKYSQQQSDLLVSVGDYYFHMPPTKEDFQELEHLGETNQSYRNPKTKMPLQVAKKTLEAYTGFKEKNTHNKESSKSSYTPPVFKRLGDSYRN